MLFGLIIYPSPYHNEIFLSFSVNKLTRGDLRSTTERLVIFALPNTYFLNNRSSQVTLGERLWFWRPKKIELHIYTSGLVNPVFLGRTFKYLLTQCEPLILTEAPCKYCSRTMSRLFVERCFASSSCLPAMDISRMQDDNREIKSPVANCLCGTRRQTHKRALHEAALWAQLARWHANGSRLFLSPSV